MLIKRHRQALFSKFEKIMRNACLSIFHTIIISHQNALVKKKLGVNYFCRFFDEVAQIIG